MIPDHFTTEDGAFYLRMPPGSGPSDSASMIILAAGAGIKTEWTTYFFIDETHDMRSSNFFKFENEELGMQFILIFGDHDFFKVEEVDS